MPLLWTAAELSALMRRGQPAAEPGGRLALVHRLAVPLRRRGRGRDRCGSGRLRPLPAGLLGGVAGGLVMPLPAFLWGLASGRGIWYPVNLLAGDGRAAAGRRCRRPNWMQFHRRLAGRGDRDPRVHVARLRRRSSACSCRGSGRSPAAGLGRPAHAAALDGGQLRPDGRRQSAAPAAGATGPGSSSRSSSSGSRRRSWWIARSRSYIPPAGPGPEPLGRVRAPDRARVSRDRATLAAGPHPCPASACWRPAATSRASPGRRPAGPGGPGRRLRDPVRPELRRVSRGRRQVRPGAAAERPAFLAIVPDGVLSRVIAEGRPGTPMPAFARSRGGPLTDAQVEVAGRGAQAALEGGSAPEAPPPAYLAVARRRQGDAARGQAVFDRACAACHGDDGPGARTKVGAINDPRSWP